MQRKSRPDRSEDFRTTWWFAAALAVVGIAVAGAARLAMADDPAKEPPAKKADSVSSPKGESKTLKPKAPSDATKLDEPPKDDAGNADEAPAAKVTAAKKWTTLFKSSPQAPLLPKALDDDAQVVPLVGFDLTGSAQDNVLLGEFKSEGNWATSRAGLQPTEPNSALLLAKAGDFELEGQMSADGLGGWFIGLGLHEGHGYLLYNVTLKTSGSPWFATELRDNRVLTGGPPVEVGRHVWKGYQPFRLLVEKNRLQLVVGKEQVVKDLDLENYHEGDLVMGSYNTKYGPKPLRIRSMRIRSR